ncbi:hypothetical protein LJ707_05055 [Mucilaginibacter sp. UR6-1]|uniref:hypothetical protein n=1 Tax=Mucilaginibacter sp. UR6-1 TaxID=1435643 RepID=UPI001E5E5054|nr:hypothetical protein [Mucilaginibacter sp. UR6-1]MCC8408288.1 hypothetical protein [Mucilaginibacter sp. UR6-1]
MSSSTNLNVRSNTADHRAFTCVAIDYSALNFIQYKSWSSVLKEVAVVAFTNGLFLIGSITGRPVNST